MARYSFFVNAVTSWAEIKKNFKIGIFQKHLMTDDELLTLTRKMIKECVDRNPDSIQSITRLTANMYEVWWVNQRKKENSTKKNVSFGDLSIYE